MTPTPPTDHAVAFARDIVTNPALCAELPMPLAGAWETLMAARGHTVNLDRLGPPRHMIGPRDAAPVDDMQAHRALRIKAAIAETYKRTGLNGPRPLILRDALPNTARQTEAATPDGT